jgi:hypothetical protein
MAFYVQAKKALATYTTEEALRDLRHGFHSNKCESLNGFITKALPKNKHTCLSNVNKARTNIIVGIDSLGYEQYFKRLFKRTGVQYTQVTRQHHQRIDKRRATQYLYKKRAESKRKRRRLLYDKIAAGNAAAEESRREGYDYGPGLMAPKDEVNEELADVDGGSSKKLVVGCGKCGKSDHKTTRSMKCYYSTNQKSVFYTGIQENDPLAVAPVSSTIVDLLPPPTPGISATASIPTDAPTFGPIGCLPSMMYDSMSGK